MMELIVTLLLLSGFAGFVICLRGVISAKGEIFSFDKGYLMFISAKCMLVGVYLSHYFGFVN